MFRLARRALLQAALAAALGALSGLACVLARLVFLGLQVLFTGHPGLLPAVAAALPAPRRALVPIGGALCAWLVNITAHRWLRVPHARDYLEAIRDGDARVPLASTVWRTAASAFSVATGAAIGREGSMIQFAAAIVSSASGLPVLSRDVQLACGIAGAVGAVYQAPIAGIFFASEIALGATRRWHHYPLLALASACGAWVNGRLLVHGPIFAAPGPAAPHTWLPWAAVALLGLLLGALSPAYRALVGSLHAARRLPLALLWGGAAVGLLSLSTPAVWGNGDGALLHLLGNPPQATSTLHLLLTRLAATTACVGVGTVGGVFTPTVFAGAALGVLAATALPQVPAALLATAGIASLLAGATSAPLMAMCMAAELTGRWDLLPWLALSAALTTLVAQRIARGSLYGIASTNPVRPPAPGPA